MSENRAPRKECCNGQLQIASEYVIDQQTIQIRRIRTQCTINKGLRTHRPCRIAIIRIIYPTSPFAHELRLLNDSVVAFQPELCRTVANQPEEVSALSTGLTRVPFFSMADSRLVHFSSKNSVPILASKECRKHLTCAPRLSAATAVG